jgi:hypothetical protein
VAAFIISLVLGWVPLFILCVCLVVKLNGIDHKNDDGNIRLALIFMPFWLIEGIIMMGSLVFLAVGINQYRRGFILRIDEHIGKS